jgi:hypothetical protein
MMGLEIELAIDVESAEERVLVAFASLPAWSIAASTACSAVWTFSALVIPPPNAVRIAHSGSDAGYRVAAKRTSTLRG